MLSSPLWINEKLSVVMEATRGPHSKVNHQATRTLINASCCSDHRHLQIIISSTNERQHYRRRFIPPNPANSLLLDFSWSTRPPLITLALFLSFSRADANEGSRFPRQELYKPDEACIISISAPRENVYSTNLMLKAVLRIEIVVVSPLVYPARLHDLRNFRSQRTFGS